jgi:hypothetical protein
MGEGAKRKWEGATLCAGRTMGEGAKRQWEARRCARVGLWARARSANGKARRCARIGLWARARSAARYARRRALPVYGSDNPRRATVHTCLANGKAQRAAVGECAKRGRVCSLATCEVLFGARRRARARSATRSAATCEVLFGAGRRVRARRRCVPRRVSA